MADPIPLEAKIFRAATMLVGAVGLLSSILNILNDSSFTNTLLAVLTFATGVVFYFLSSPQEDKERLHLPFVLFLLSISNAYWFSNNGYAGSTPLFLMALVVLSTMLLKGRTAFFVFGLMVADVIFLVTLTHFRPDLMTQQFSAQNREADISFTLLICLFATGALVQLLTSAFRAEREKNALLYERTLQDKAALEVSLNEIRVLKGILPICSFCKKIRDDQSKWQDMETYITERSNAQFSHSFCPECGEKHYGDYLE